MINIVKARPSGDHRMVSRDPKERHLLKGVSQTSNSFTGGPPSNGMTAILIPIGGPLITEVATGDQLSIRRN